jgi:cation diffusion facilitator CzcD-associated flavoprotein CzcO
MTGTVPSTSVAIIGTGFGGLGMAYHLKKAGIHSFLIFEKAQEVGGVWRENTYPGAACDVPSHLYSFSFESRYPWRYRYARQPEILAYLRHCAQKHEIYPHIRFGQEVTDAAFDEKRGVWTITLRSGERHEASVLISAVGQLHRPSVPRFEGQKSFRGKAFHSAQWDHDYDLAGKSVAVIGAGASAVQFVPEIAGKVKRLTLFQRSPGWVAPKFEKPFGQLERRLFDSLPLLQDLDRARVFLITEALGYSYRGHAVAERMVRALATAQLRLQVRSPELRKALTPDFPVGCKRILLTTQWLPALARPNVEVVGSPIRRFRERALETADGRSFDADAVIYGTGFAATEFLAPMRVRGLDGRLLQDEWKAGAQAYLGMAVPAFPNFFVLYGPNSNLGSGSIVYMLESQQRYIVEALRNMARLDLRSLEVRQEAMDDFVAWVRARSRESTYEGSCQSWYKTADGINTNNWIGSQRAYRLLTRSVSMEHYRQVPRQRAPLGTAAALA